MGQTVYSKHLAKYLNFKMQMWCNYCFMNTHEHGCSKFFILEQSYILSFISKYFQFLFFIFLNLTSFEIHGHLSTAESSVTHNWWVIASILTVQRVVSRLIAQITITRDPKNFFSSQDRNNLKRFYAPPNARILTRNSSKSILGQ